METHVPATTNADGTIVVTPQTGAPTGAPNANVTAASEAARALIASQGTAQPRASDGTFGTPLPPAPAAAAAAPATPAPAPATGLDGQKPAGAPAEGEQPPAGEAPAEAAKTPEEIAAEAERAARLVTIEWTDGNAIDLELGDADAAEVVRSIVETARAAETVRAESQQQIDDALAIRDYAEIDPVGFAQTVLAESPAGQDHLVLSLLSQPEVFTRLKDTIARMVTDPATRELVQAKQQAARHQYADQAQHQRAEQAAVRTNVNEIKTTCAAMARLIPNQAMAETAYNDMLRDVQAYAGQANVLTVPVESIPVILTRRLTALGLDPMQAAQAATKALGSKRPITAPRATAVPAQATPRPAPAGAPGTNNAPARSAPNGAAFVASAQNRRVVAAIPAAGAGSPAVGPDLVPPKKADGSPMNTTETIAWHREQVKLGKRGLVTA